MANHYQTLLFQVAELRRQMHSMVRCGTVEEVDGDKLRINYGNDPDGKPVIGPWIHHSNHRGGSTERRFFSDKKGQGQGGQGGSGGGGAGGGGGQQVGGQHGGQQNVTVICPGGDPRQAFVIPFAPNKGHPPPDHANESGKDEETYQFKDHRQSKGEDGVDWWIEKEEKKSYPRGGGGQSGGGQSGGQQSQGRKRGEKGDVRMHFSKEHGVTAFVKDNETRFAVHKKGVKMRDKKQWFVVDPDKRFAYLVTELPPKTAKPWELKFVKDDIPNDSGSSGGGGGGGGGSA
jgi:hypothetical protein